MLSNRRTLTLLTCYPSSVETKNEVRKISQTHEQVATLSGLGPNPEVPIIDERDSRYPIAGFRATFLGICILRLDRWCSNIGGKPCLA